MASNSTQVKIRRMSVSQLAILALQIIKTKYKKSRKKME